MLSSVITTVGCLTWFLEMYFGPAPKHMIRLSVDYWQDSKIPIRLWKSLVGLIYADLVIKKHLLLLSMLKTVVLFIFSLETDTFVLGFFDEQKVQKSSIHLK